MTLRVAPEGRGFVAVWTYWFPERKLTEDRYRTIENVAGYIRTWSARLARWPVAVRVGRI
jgi:hypothetical protein